MADSQVSEDNKSEEPANHSPVVTGHPEGGHSPAVTDTAIAVKEDAGALAAKGTRLAATVADEAAEMILIQEAIDANVDQSELQISRLAIMQPQSPEITGQEMGFSPGQIVDNINREIYTDHVNPPWLAGKVEADKLSPVYCCLIVPIFKLPSEYIKWIKKDEQEPGGDMWEFKTLDQNDPRVREGVWAPIGTFKGDKPPVTSNINMLCLVLDAVTGIAKSSFIVATFTRTSFSTGKNLVTQCKQHGMSGLPYWGRTYWLYTKPETRMVGSTESTYCIYKIAKGPALEAVNGNAERTIRKFALWLADPELGRVRQESLINSAEIESGGEPTQSTEEDDDDPFAKKNESQPGRPESGHPPTAVGHSESGTGETASDKRF